MAGASTPLGAAACDIYRRFVAEGGRGRDFSAILLRLEAAAGAGQLTPPAGPP